MTFSDKIDIILTSNKLGVHSISALEDFCGLGRNTLQNAYDQNREPTLKTLVKIYDKMRVTSSWWNTGKGEIFEEKLTSVPKVEEDGEGYQKLTLEQELIAQNRKYIAILEANYERAEAENRELRSKLAEYEQRQVPKTRG